MKKRLLCYDEDNPVGIDENGVLNPSALGGGAFLTIVSEMDLNDPSLTEDVKNFTIECDDIENFLDKVQNGEPVTIIHKKARLYGDVFEYSTTPALTIDYYPTWSTPLKIEFIKTYMGSSEELKVYHWAFNITSEGELMSTDRNSFLMTA